MTHTEGKNKQTNKQKQTKKQTKTKQKTKEMRVEWAERGSTYFSPQMLRCTFFFT